MRRDVFLLSLAAFTSSASLRATDPLLPLIAEDYDVTTGAAAGAVTGFALAYGLLQVVCGPLGDRYGRYRTIAAAAFVSAFGSLACALAPDLGSLIIARFVAGATIGAFIPLSLAWIGDSFPYAERQPVLARFLIGQMVGIGFGTALAGGLSEHFGWRAIFVLLAAVARKFVCICDASKLVPVLGKFPLPLEVIPMARSYVGREMLKRGAQPVLRENYKTDNGNLILDCHGLVLLDPPIVEAEFKNIAGVVTNGIFARRPADVLLLGEPSGVRTIAKK